MSVSQRPQAAPASLTLTYILMLVAVLLWGGNWAAAKLAIAAVPPITLATLRYAVSTPILLAWMAWQGPLPRERGCCSMSTRIGCGSWSAAIALGIRLLRFTGRTATANGSL